MKKTLLALTAAATFGIAGLAVAPASAAPLAPAHLAVHETGNQVQQAHYISHSGPWRRHVRRHFWAPGPWAFGRVPYQNCFRVGHGFICYY